MSTHECPVVSVTLENHPNADTLSLTKVFGFQCAVRTADWKDGDLGVYIPPDSVVPDTEPFQFLKRPNSTHWNRIRVVRLRGAISMGLLLKAPEGAKVGDNLMEALGVTHYEPPLPVSTGGDNEKGPPGWYPTYDVENLRRYNNVLKPGEEVIVTEKIHGANGRYVFTEDRMWCGSRTSWKREADKNLWWQALRKNPWIESWCRANPNLMLYGEVFGQVQNLKYGTKPGEVRFAVFDILRDGAWLLYTKALRLETVPGFQSVPLVWVGPYNEDRIIAMSDGPSLVHGANHIREGVVVKPVIARDDPEIGRVQLKVVSNKYLEKDF